MSDAVSYAESTEWRPEAPRLRPLRLVVAWVVAAISVAGPAYRLSTEDLPRAAEVLLRAAAQISRRLGFRAEVTG